MMEQDFDIEKEIDILPVHMTTRTHRLLLNFFETAYHVLLW